MVSSACEILLTEPDRFVDYIISNPKLRSKIYDEDSFGEVLEKALKSDSSLVNIPQHIKKKGETMSMCGGNIFKLKSIQRLVKSNVNSKERQIRERVKTQKPKLKGKNLTKEVQRRLRISIKQSKPRKLKQVTIEEATRPVKVRSYTRAGKTVKGRSRTKARDLTRSERNLILNGIKKGKKAREVIDNYYKAGYKFRTRESIRKYYYRLQ